MRRLAVIGVEPRRRRSLERIGEEEGFEVRSLLSFGRVRKAESYDIDELLDEAREQLDGERIDGITTFWDFPSSCLAPILADERGLPSPSLRSVVSFENKYWSRLTQRQVAPDDTAPFAPVDVFADDAADEPPLPYPFWLKPVKSRAGVLGFRVGSDDDYRSALEQLRRGIHRLGRPFARVMEFVDDVPDEVAAVGGTGAIAEGIIDGDQCTLEGHVHAGEVDIHGIFDIHRAEDRSTFTHYTYPSFLSDAARERMRTIAVDLIEAVGYDDAAFNIEFFVDEADERSWILEVNPRISQEHSYLMDWVDGATNLEVMAEVALGERPKLETGSGEAAVAGKFFLRRSDDAVVVHVPDEDEIHDLEERFAPCVIEPNVEPGDRLSELRDQEPYSYILAYVHLAADSKDELYERYDQVVEAMDLRFDPVDGAD